MAGPGLIQGWVGFGAGVGPGLIQGYCRAGQGHSMVWPGLGQG